MNFSWIYLEIIKLTSINTVFAGLLREEISIYKLTTSRNSFGEEVETRTKNRTTRAKVGHASGSRSVINSEVQYPYQRVFVIRMGVPINEDCWIEYKGKNYRVLSIDEDPELQQQVINTEVVNE